MHGHTLTHTTCGFEMIRIWEVYWSRHRHRESAVHINTSVTGGKRPNMLPFSQLSHSFREAIKMSLKHFVLTIENKQFLAWVQQQSKYCVNGATGYCGRGWRNVEFKLKWCHCIKPVSANQLCAWREKEGEREACR